MDGICVIAIFSPVGNTCAILVGAISKKFTRLDHSWSPGAGTRTTDTQSSLDLLWRNRTHDDRREDLINRGSVSEKEDHDQAEDHRRGGTEAVERRARDGNPVEESGDPTSARGSGERSARTTAKTATPGTTSLTIRRDPGPIAGERTVWPASPTINNACASRSRCGTGKTRSSKNACSG